VFVTNIYFDFEGKAGAYQSGTPYQTVMIGSSLTCKYHTIFEVNGDGKHSSLLGGGKFTTTRRFIAHARVKHFSFGGEEKSLACIDSKLKQCSLNLQCPVI
jgi:hypothetical protein